jgi:hypothetical protein
MNIEQPGRDFGSTLEQVAELLCIAYSLSDFKLLLLSCQAFDGPHLTKTSHDFSNFHMSSID